ncbi:hypothetical protein LXL04_035904 [Taraxacum kok-saghyz]
MAAGNKVILKHFLNTFFVSCTLSSNYVLDEQIGVEKRYHMFYNRMNEYLTKYQQHINFQQTDLVFFLIVSNDHYYMIVFNLQKESCTIIDNIASQHSVYTSYGNIPYDLDVLFKLYLDSVKHPKRSRMKRVSPTKFRMSWMTKYNYIDCGIFLMRHMETYKGQHVDDWDVNLEDEVEDSDDQQIQLHDLRRKYVTKILISDLNIHIASVYSYLPQYDELPIEKKMEFDTYEHFDMMQIRIGFLD